MNPPESQRAVEVPDEAVAAAKQTAGLLSPICDVCSVAYVDDYRGPCQEPLPPYDDPSKTCPGKVDLTPECIAERAVAAAAPVLCAQEREQGAQEERKRQERYAASEREEAMRRLLKAEAERDQAAQQERERVKEALKGGEVREAVERALCGFELYDGDGSQIETYAEPTGAVSRAVLEAALTTLDKEGR